MNNKKKIKGVLKNSIQIDRSATKTSVGGGRTVSVMSDLRYHTTNNDQQADDPFTMCSFTKEQFKQLITNTCNDWYYDRTLEWDYSNFMDII